VQQVHERSSVLVFIYKYMAPRFLALAGDFLTLGFQGLRIVL
jgi:hypothetical protein